MEDDRRTNRSEVISEALRMQLEATRNRIGCRALVITESTGMPVSFCGDAAQIEEFVAKAPLLTQKSVFWQGEHLFDDGNPEKVTVATIHTDFGNLFLCAAGGKEFLLGAKLIHSGRGIKRILA